MRNSLGDDIKIIIVGNYNSGKTAFVERYVRNKFSEIYKPTIMSEFAYKTTEIDSKSYRIHIWDLAGIKKIILKVMITQNVLRKFFAKLHMVQSSLLIF